ncbi:hypothetical protein R1sor_007850 [Riccia sorocarpa]|uniref:Cytochrome P450 n=1 Tax=Riccia sorocarpa TaxID=122646 RepID=A0ABD3HV41_9MARC
MAGLGRLTVWTLALAIFLNIVAYLVSVFRVTVWMPYKLHQIMRKKGYSGPSLSWAMHNRDEAAALCINSRQAAKSLPRGTVDHCIRQRVLPHYFEWARRYGRRFVCSPRKASHCMLWAGNEPEVIREVLVNCKKADFGKSQTSASDALLGRGGLVLVSDYHEWARQRRAVRPVFYAGKVKETGTIMTEVARAWLTSLSKTVLENGGSAEVEMGEQIGMLTKDILARTAFGSDYVKGRRGFDGQHKLKFLEFQTGGYIHPIMRRIPTKINKEIQKTRDQVTKSLMEIIDERRRAVKLGERDSYGDDLLGVILADGEAHNSNPMFKKWTDEQLVDQCRTFFFAGHDTVRVSISWVLIMLAHYTDWQQRIREEVIKVLGDDEANFHAGAKLQKLNLLHQFIYETMRLYPPVPQIVRQVVKDGATLLGEPVPKNLDILMEPLTLHRNPEYWGKDAEEFKPERFARGIAQACKHPYAYIPFGAGPRICVAQTQAMTELLLITVMVIMKFRFQLSPSYVHNPTHCIVLEPSGVQLILHHL